MGALSLVGGPGERGAGRVALGEQARAGRGKKAGPRWAVRERKKGGTAWAMRGLGLGRFELKGCFLLLGFSFYFLFPLLFYF